MSTWTSDTVPRMPSITAMGWIRIVLRGLPIVLITYGGLILLLLIRLVERPLCGLRRPVTPWITQGVCRSALFFMGFSVTVTGRPMDQRGAVVANHSSWLDIFTLNAFQRIYFVSKAEVAKWPGIGWLARATGTVFITRDRREAKAQSDLFEARLTAGHKLLFFPEGTSSDGQRVLPFKPTLFAAFFAPDLRDILHIQPMSVLYTAPEGEDPRFYGWWGDMDFGGHLLHVLAMRRNGSVEITFHPPIALRDVHDRKALAAQCEDTVRSAYELWRETT
ncbi:lysophospholipid acyltransferase family protein [Tropicimonas sp. S265A]|uniref:lysophospholipid acyltransferase family protein n=1 Tax=Tropicimonas sp. S265A TaxID=3415134 RepID=UPI003C7C5C8B